jgi:hypothetical protein
MSETALTKPKPKTNSDYQALAEQLLIEMDRLEEQMDEDRAESERLKTETQVIKAETEIIKARAAATLSQLMQQVEHLAQAGR